MITLYQGRQIFVPLTKPQPHRLNGDGSASILIDTKHDLWVTFDEGELQRLLPFKWHTRGQRKKIKYASTRNCFDLETGKPRTVHMHRLLMDTPKGLVVDHVDFDGLNNRLGNMRNITSGQNTIHRRKQKHNRSGWIGVRKAHNKRGMGGMHTVKIGHKWQDCNLGYHMDPEVCALAYNVACELLKGELGVLNPVKKGPNLELVAHVYSRLKRRQWADDVDHVRLGIMVGKLGGVLDVDRRVISRGDQILGTIRYGGVLPTFL